MWPKLVSVPLRLVGKLFSKNKLKINFNALKRTSGVKIFMFDEILLTDMMNKFAPDLQRRLFSFQATFHPSCKNFPHLGGICSLIGSGFVTTTRMRFVGEQLSGSAWQEPEAGHWALGRCAPDSGDRMEIKIEILNIKM